MVSTVGSPSKATKIFARVLSFLVGVILFVSGLYVILKDVHLGGTSHGTNAAIGGIMILLGCGFMMPIVTFAIAKNILSMIGPYLPEIKIGGMRKTDPPADNPAEPQINQDPNAKMPGVL